MKDKNIRIKDNCLKLKCAKQMDIIKGNFKFCIFAMQKKSKNRKLSKKRQKAQKSDKKLSSKKKLVLLACGAVIGFLNGFFGGGGGMICVRLLQKSLSLDAKHSHATAIAVIFPLSLISAFIYVINGYIKSFPLLTIGIGVVAGGIIGAFTLKFLPPKAIRLIFAIIMFVGGIKLII